MHFFPRYLKTGIVLLVLGGFGCKHQPDSQSQAKSIAPETAQKSSPAQPDAMNDDAALLAQKTSQYAQDVGPLLQKHSTEAAPATQPSVVQWVDPRNMTQEKQPFAPAPVTPLATTRPAQAAKTPGPAPNSPASLASARLPEDFGDPLILPESADQAPRQPVTISSDALENKLRQLVHDYPRDLGNQLDYQLLRFARDEATPELSSTAGLSSEDREILSAVMDGLNNLRNTSRAEGDVLLGRKIAPLLEMADRLRSQAELSIPTVALCTEVKSYGVYTPLQPARMGLSHDDKGNQIIVYCEIANFTSVQNDEKFWETRLKEEIVLYTESGVAVWPEKSNAVTSVDLARNRRHDFFIPRKITLPSTLSMGRYLLKITLTDEQSNRMAEATTPIEIVAP